MTVHVTPENFQQAASTIEWELKGVQGPIEHPQSTVMQSPACFSNDLSDGTQWTTAEPSTGSTKTFSPTLQRSAETRLPDQSTVR